jgi:hypothetical protein
MKTKLLRSQPMVFILRLLLFFFFFYFFFFFFLSLPLLLIPTLGAAQSQSRVVIHGRLSNGLDYDFELDPPGLNSYVGRKVRFLTYWLLYTIPVVILTASHCC